MKFQDVTMLDMVAMLQRRLEQVDLLQEDRDDLIRQVDTLKKEIKELTEAVELDRDEKLKEL